MEQAELKNEARGSQEGATEGLDIDAAVAIGKKSGDIGSLANNGAADENAAVSEAASTLDDGNTTEALDAEETERRERVEHEALVATVKDVRTESADGRLVQPARWEEIGVVPAHLTLEDWEMLVYDRLQAYFAEEAERAAHAAAEPAPTYRTATRAVGVPRAFDPAARAEDEARAAAGRAHEAGVSTGEGMDAAGAREHTDGPVAPVAATRSATAVATSPVTSPQGAGVSPDRPSKTPDVASIASSSPTAAEEDDGVFEPFELTVEGVRGMVQLVDGEPTFVPYAPGEAPREELDFTGIKLLQGRLTYYLYDSGAMTDTFANWAFMAAEQNDAVTLVTLAREESRTYPRPMPADSLKNDPFHFDNARIEAAWREAHESGDYPDVEEAFASNGDRYFFSTDHISRAYAESLAEWASVERYRNV